MHETFPKHGAGAARWLLAAASCCAPGIALAQSAAPEIVVVTGSRLSHASAARTDISEADVAAQNPASLADVMRQAPGVAVSAPGGAGGVPEIFLRGAESNFTVVLIDGVRVNDPSNARGGGFDFSTLDPAEIERVSIVRGPLSAVHGSDAMAGVISIETLRPSAELSVRLRAEAGEDGFARAFASASGQVTENVRLGVRAAHVDLGEPTEGATQTLDTLQGAVDADTGATHWRGGVRYAERESTAFPDGSGGPAYAVSRELARSDAREGAAWAQMARSSAHGRFDASLSYFTRDEVTAAPAIAPGVFDASPATTSDTSFERVEATGSGVFNVSPDLEMSAGLNLANESGERVGALDLGGFFAPSNFVLERFTAGAFAEARYQAAPAWELQGALRVDHAEDEDERVSGRASFVFTQSGYSLRASWANGHKLPSFYALGDTLVGNPDLKVETSETAELAVETRIGAVDFSATAFASRYRDLIDFDFSTFRLINRSEARINGVELAARAALSEDLTLAANAVFSDIGLDGQDRALLNRPERYGAVSMTWRPRVDWMLRGDANFVGERSGSAIPTGPRALDAYARLDATLARDVGEDASFFVTTENLTNEDYEEAVGFPSPGRRVRAGVSLRL